ncbi:hypothetical protein GRAN_0361 [Granulicella sibirica]|uniref:Uncharacterized protein n=1 Tax=Granulicella sibirica TaxID=2479048 RepID=A0A4Q0T649_9BACT|nr:hypothetical protein GRAN_0361 [Granulicella sibirica]
MIRTPSELLSSFSATVMGAWHAGHDSGALFTGSGQQGEWSG